MITPDILHKKINRLYLSFLKSWLNKEEGFFPLTVPVGKIPRKDYHALRDGTRTLQADAEKWGYDLDYEIKIFRNLGEKTVPTQIIIPNQAIFLSIVKKKTEFRAFRADANLLHKQLPQLEPWLGDNIKSIIAYHGQWDDLIKVCEYFISHPKPNLYIRELPIKVHTKFVESYKPILTKLLDYLLPLEVIEDSEKKFEKRYGLRYSEPLVRIRILDEKLGHKYSLPFADMTIPISEAANHPIFCENCLIVENQMTFLTLPHIPNSIAIFGSGKAVSKIQHLAWLQQTNIYYWGDLDVDGFMILSNLRSYFPHAISIMMDEETFTTFEQFSIENIATATPKLPNLTAQETKIYYYLMSQQRRLEQEHISHSYMLQIVNRVSQN